jgi:hypothetical protein
MLLEGRRSAAIQVRNWPRPLRALRRASQARSGSMTIDHSAALDVLDRRGGVDAIQANLP